MKLKKYLIGLAAALALVLTIQLVPALAAEDEAADNAAAETAQQTTVTIQKAVITCSAPVTGKTVKELNESLTWDDDDLLVNSKQWLDENSKAMAEDSTFEAKKSYKLVLGLCARESTVSSDTVVIVNGKTAAYDAGLTEDARKQFPKAEISAAFAISMTAGNIPAPQAAFNATGPDCGVLSGVDSSMQYSTDGSSWTKCSGGTTELTGLSEGSIQVSYISDPVNVQRINVDRQPAVSGLRITNCTSKSNNDGKISQTDTSMEYRADGADRYSACSGSEITGLKAGKYYIRRAAGETHLSSGDTLVTIAKFKSSVPVITQQPADATVRAGESCQYIIKADNAKKYEWHVIDIASGKDYVIDPEEDARYYEGVGTDTLTVKSVKKIPGESDCQFSGDKYYCVVINNAGKVTSDIAKYTVSHAPEKDEWCSDSTDHWQICFCGTIINKAPHADENKDGICDVCKADSTGNEQKYHILEGANSTWSGGSGEPVVLKADGELKDFVKLTIDEKPVKEENYDLSEGSTVVSLHTSYLEALRTGDHIVTFVYDKGSVSTQLSITEKEAKEAGAAKHAIGKVSNLVIVLLLVLIILLIITIVVLRKRLRKYR